MWSLQSIIMAFARAIFVSAAVALSLLGNAPLSAQSPTDLTGSWTLNRQSSQFPQEVGFSASFLPADPAGNSDRGGRRRVQSETQEDASRVRFLTDEVRLPPDRLSIDVTPALVTITPDPGAPRTVQLGLRDQALKIGPVTAIANTAWDGSRLTVAYDAGGGRVIRYSYSNGQNSLTLVVDVEFIEGGRGGDRVRRVYDRTNPNAAPSTTPASSSATQPPASIPASPPPTSGTIDQRPDASLKGLARLGVVVEGSDASSAKCGLKQDVIEAAVTKRLTDAGLRVVRDSDDDTYLYVNLNTVTASGTLCVSRYDVTLYSHTAAQLTHTTSPVLLQVELLHKGGLAGGAPAAHADDVLKSVLEYVGQFSTRIRDANR
jgi:hypothetical protein